MFLEALQQVSAALQHVAVRLAGSNRVRVIASGFVKFGKPAFKNFDFGFQLRRALLVELGADGGIFWTGPAILHGMSHSQGINESA